LRIFNFIFTDGLIDAMPSPAWFPAMCARYTLTLEQARLVIACGTAARLFPMRAFMCPPGGLPRRRLAPRLLARTLAQSAAMMRVVVLLCFFNRFTLPFPSSIWHFHTNSAAERKPT
jgi:hypothetical protein